MLFAEDTRHQARIRMTILQALYNAVDLVKEALPKGTKRDKKRYNANFSQK